MSGIVGIYHPNQQLVKPRKLQQMLDVLAHRGSDGADFWCQENVGLGHRMLWTTPESLLEKLPGTNSTGELTITADARIDNRDELIATLKLDDLPSEKITDSQIILAAYEEWGEACPDKLLGDFAFAIWDRQLQKLFCARDHFGVKPFYYYHSDSIFTFASEIKGIFTLPEIPCQIDETRIANYSIGNFDELNLTSYQGIYRLPPAHCLSVNSNGIGVKRYWSLDLNRQTILESDRAYAVEFRKIFTEAVRCRLRSAFPIGSKLSGGLDSSAIACIAKQLLNENSSDSTLHTFSAIFDRIAECDEREYIDEVLKQHDFQAHYLSGDSRTPLSDLEDIFWHQDEAFFAPGFAIMSWGLCKLAKEKGVRIVLDGYDGDSTVSHGYGYLHDLAKAGRWLALFVEVKGIAKIYNESVWRGYWNYFYAYGIRQAIARHKPLRAIDRVIRKIAKLVKPQNSINNFQPNFLENLNPDFVERTNLVERYQTWLKAEHYNKVSSVRDHYRCLTQGLHPLALEIDNNAAAAFEQEIRYPFWDKRLVEFCLSLPPEQKLFQGWTRIVMRRAMEGVLPEKIQWRTSKMDFSPNLIDGLLNREKQRLEELIGDRSEILEPYIKIDILREKYHEGKDIQLIWRFVSLGLWLHYFAANNSQKSAQLSEIGQ